MFISAETFKPLKVETFEEGKAEVLLSLPPIIEDKATADQISGGIDKGGEFLNAFTTGNFFINLLLKGSM